MKSKEKINRKGQMQNKNIYGFNQNKNQNANRNNTNRVSNHNRTKLLVPRNGMKKEKEIIC